MAIKSYATIEAAPTVQAEKTTNYTLAATDNGTIIPFNSASALTVTVPSGLPVPFTCMIFQKGTGQVTIGTSSTTRQHRLSHTKTAGQYSFVSIVLHVSNTFAIQGDTAT